MCKKDLSITVNNRNVMRPVEEEYIGVKVSEGEANYSSDLTEEAVRSYENAS